MASLRQQIRFKTFFLDYVGNWQKLLLNFFDFLKCSYGSKQYLADLISYSRSLPQISPFVIRKSVSSQDNPENIGDADHADTEYGDNEGEVFIV